MGLYSSKFLEQCQLMIGEYLRTETVRQYILVASSPGSLLENGGESGIFSHVIQVGTDRKTAAFLYHLPASLLQHSVYGTNRLVIRSIDSLFFLGIRGLQLCSPAHNYVLCTPFLTHISKDTGDEANIMVLSLIPMHCCKHLYLHLQFQK